jgi:hypothetical protein
MLSPLPAELSIRLQFKRDSTGLDIAASVVSSHMGMGMDIAVTSMTPADFEALRKVAPPARPVP